MKRPHKSLLPSERKIIDQIIKVRKTADLVSRSKRRFAEYRYLKAILRAYRYLNDNELLSAMMEVAPAVLIVPVRSGWHPLRVLVEATMWKEIETKTRSRWTRALECALAQNIPSDQLPQFFRANGGVAGAADLMSKTRPKRRKTESRPANISSKQPASSIEPSGRVPTRRQWPFLNRAGISCT